MVVSIFVENDTSICGGQHTMTADATAPSVLLLTGANYSGKSVYLKQVT